MYNDPNWKELLTIRYRATLANKLQIMPKDEMRKMGLVSPDVADGLALTLTREDRKEVVEIVSEFDRYDVI